LVQHPYCGWIIILIIYFCLSYGLFCCYHSQLSKPIHSFDFFRWKIAVRIKISNLTSYATAVRGGVKMGYFSYTILSKKKSFAKIFDPDTNGRNYSHPCNDYLTHYAFSLVQWLKIDK
jgi:hypothetical protein